MDELPNHLLRIIFSLLQDTSDLNTIAQVNKRFFDLERKQRQSLKVGCRPQAGCSLHPLEFALASLCTRFQCLSKIEVVYAGWTSNLGKQLDDKGLQIISALCPNLRELSLSFCTFITDASLGHLVACKGLKAVKLNFVPRITGRGLLSLVTCCKSLTVLHLILCVNVSSAQWLYSLGHLEKIEDLAICRCKGIGEGDLAKLGHAWRKLRKFQFQVEVNHRYMKTYGDSAGYSWEVQEADCDALEELHLINCLISPNRGLGHIISKCKALVRLNLDTCVALRDRELIMLAKSNPFLKSLFLRCSSDFSPCVPSNYSPQLTDEGLKAFAEYCDGLEEVSISFTDGCYPFVPGFSMAGILALIEGCSLLRVLVLNKVYAFNDRGMEALSVSHSLETLQLVECQEVSDDGILLLKSLPSLKQLKLSKCLGVSDGGLTALLEYCKLESLIVEDCPRISERGTRGTAKFVSFRCDLSWLF